jgi:hypothetical protein
MAPPSVLAGTDYPVRVSLGLHLMPGLHVLPGLFGRAAPMAVLTDGSRMLE